MPFVFADDLTDVRARLARIERFIVTMQRAMQNNTDRIMSAISDFSAAMNTFFDRQSVAMDGLKGDIDWLVAKIAELQATPGAITPEDQALLDAIQARAGAASTKAEELDAMTPPAAPTP